MIVFPGTPPGLVVSEFRSVNDTRGPKTRLDRRLTPGFATPIAAAIRGSHLALAANASASCRVGVAPEQRIPAALFRRGGRRLPRALSYRCSPVTRSCQCEARSLELSSRASRSMAEASNGNQEHTRHSIKPRAVQMRDSAKLSVAWTGSRKLRR